MDSLIEIDNVMYGFVNYTRNGDTLELLYRNKNNPKEVIIINEQVKTLPNKITLNKLKENFNSNQKISNRFKKVDLVWDKTKRGKK